MYEYKTEILRTGIKLFSDKASEGDASQFNEVFNQKAEEGWELTTYTYMAEVLGVRGALLVTYRKLK
jgi:hypothetical protein